MAKVSGSYESIMRGVSQQPTEQRLNGQHSEQVNMMSDPVVGLTRRRGSVHVHDAEVRSTASNADISDFRRFSTHSFKLGTQDYTLVYRTYSQVTEDVSRQALHCYHVQGAAFIPVIGLGFGADVLLSEGIKSIAQVGRYLVMSRGGTGEGAAVNTWDGYFNKQDAVIWIKGGVYSRTYSATVTIAGVNYTATYTTPSSSYPGTLDTSGVPAAATDYQKQVNDLVNAYNSAVTQWIGTAAAAIQPAAIATELRDALVAVVPLGTGDGIEVVKSTIVIRIGSLEGVEANDGGDGTLAVAVHQTVRDASELSTTHVTDKLVKVQAKDGDPAYYVKAVNRVLPGASPAAWTDVTWEEAAGASYTYGHLFIIATVEDGALVLDITPAGLQSQLPGIVVPQLEGRKVGDSESNPAPLFSGRSIDYLGVFQDRLVVGSGAVLAFSEVGNYFNFFRTSVLTVVDSDPVEVYAVGSEDDTIRHSVLYDKSLLLFGDEQQYVINGRVPVTPATTALVPSSSYEGTTLCPPVASGDFVFYTKESEGSTQVYQLAVGQTVSDVASSTEITQQLSDYIGGAPRSIVATTTPNMLFVKAAGRYNELFTFRYIDTQGGQQRLQDAWSRWEFSPLCGDLIGVSVDKGTLLLYWARYGTTLSVPTTYLAVDRISLLGSRDPLLPYLDSQRLMTDPTGYWEGEGEGLAAAGMYAPDETPNPYLHGEAPLVLGGFSLTEEFTQIGTFYWRMGTPFTSSVTLTSPYRRDFRDVAINDGRLTVTSARITVKNTSGLSAEVSTKFGTAEVLNFNGLVLGETPDIPDVPVVSTTVPVLIGREAREYSLTLKSIKWKPLTITAVEWTGQSFYNTRRV